MQSTFIGNQAQTRMSTYDPDLTLVRAKEPSKTEGWAIGQNEHLVHQMGERQASHLGQPSRA